MRTERAIIQQRRDANFLNKNLNKVKKQEERRELMKEKHKLTQLGKGGALLLTKSLCLLILFKNCQ